MFRKRFAVKQKLKKDIAAAAAAAAERDRRRPLGIPARYFTEIELAALQPFSLMFSLDDNLEEDLMALVETEEEAERAAWLENNLGRYRCVECKRER